MGAWTSRNGALCGPTVSSVTIPGGDPRFALAMQHSPVGMSVVAPDGAFLDVNDALCAMLGRSAEDLMASTWQELTHPDDLAIDASLVAEVLDGSRDSYRLAKRYLRPDGSVVHGDLSVACVRDVEGRVSYFVSQIVDLTERELLAERYRLLAENVTDVVVLGDDDGVMRWVSPSITTLMGWHPEDLVGRPFRELVHPDDLPVVVDGQSHVAHGEPAQFAVRLRDHVGEHRWVNVRVRPVLDEHGNVLGRIAAWWDADVEHRVLEDLARSEERYRSALALKLDAHVFLDAVRDADGEIVDFVYADANQPALDYLGVGKDELRAATMLTAYPGQRTSGLFDRYVATVETGEPIVLDEIAIRSEVRDGETYFDFRGVKVGDGVSLTWRDVTSRVLARDELAEAEERHRLLAENANDVVLRSRPDGTIDWAAGSVEELFGLPAEELVGRTAREMLVPQDVVIDVEGRRAALAAGRTLTGRSQVQRPDGTTRWVNHRSTAIRGDDGEIRWFVTSFSDAAAEMEFREALLSSQAQALDLAERYERARNEALEANQAKTVFLSRMSHELRTPLNAILGFAQLLAMDDLTDDQVDAVHQIRTGGRHLLDLISEILDISRIESGRLSLSMESVAVADAVDEALDLVRPLADAAGVAVTRGDGGRCTSFVWADRQRVIQILLNLLSNGVKYNRAGGTVEVSCETLPGGMLAITVADTGPGLDAGQLSHIFEPFDRLGAERTEVEGTGIGLTLSEALARLMSGRLEVTSTVGAGSVFSLVLPSSTPVDADTDIVVPAVEFSGEPPTSVLYVEDNPANIHLMERIAGLRAGVRLRVATTGSAGLDAVADEVPDLVLLDLHLPDLQGEGVLARLRAMPSMAGVPVVIVTADASAGVAQRLVGLGAQAVLTKPIDVGEVLRWLDRPQRGRDGE